MPLQKPERAGPAAQADLSPLIEQLGGRLNHPDSTAHASAQSGEGVRDARAALLRDFVYEALAPVEHDAAAARHSLATDDDRGTEYHLRRIITSVKAAASTFNELEALLRDAQVFGETASR
jgi:hypothetical protein